MSAADSISKVGGGVKNLAIGAGILAALAAAWWTWKNAGKVAEVAKDAGGFLFGSDSAPSTLGTWAYDATHKPEPYFDDTQAGKTCAALYPPGSGKTPKPGGVCERLLAAEAAPALY